MIFQSIVARIENNAFFAQIEASNMLMFAWLVTILILSTRNYYPLLTLPLQNRRWEAPSLMTSVAARPLHPALHYWYHWDWAQCNTMQISPPTVPQCSAATGWPTSAVCSDAGTWSRGGEEAVTGIKWAAEYYNAMLMMLYLPRSTTKQ